MKTLVRISTDYFSNLSDDLYKEDINFLVNELNVCCNVDNNHFINIAEQEKRYNSSPEDYTNKITIEAKGYSQNEWQVYTLCYNENELQTNEDKARFNGLIEQLKKTFTHRNDYFCEKLEYTEIDGKKFINPEPFDMTSFSITNIEFPNKEDIKEIYVSIYGEDFDEIEINID